MKNFMISSAKMSVGVLTVIAAVSVALPASAGTVSGFYDQFGQFHFYETYTGYPANYRSITSGYNPSYNTGYETYGVRVMPISNQVVFRQGEGALAVGGTTKTSVGGSSLVVGSSATKSTSVKTATASPISSLFGKKAEAGKLEITNIAVTSGPKNIYDDKSDVNCDVTVSWETGVPTSGQVLYGTVSQPKVDTFSYPSTAPEGNSLVKSHAVKFGCLDNTTHYFRIVAFTAAERVVSDEQVIFPIKIRTQIPVVGSVESTGTSASVMTTLGKIATSPIVLILVIGGIAYFIISRILRSKGSLQAEAVHAEPSLLIPHH